MSLMSEYRESKIVLARHWPVIFFTEKKSDFQYLRHLFYLLKNENIELCYITSDSMDPLLKGKEKGVDVFYFKYLLGFIFNKLKADCMFLTMPDLQQFLFKRSPAVAEYVYVFHALVSTHQQYRPGAFDHYDTILCAGPHHEKEIRVRENKYKLPKKNLMPYGYPLLEGWNPEMEKINTTKITIAPSWYPGCILETCFYELVENLQKVDCNVEVRFHPEFVKRRKKRYEEIARFIKATPDITLDTEPDVRVSLSKTNILITDRSGIAFEFALATGRPVIFIDTAPKKFNDEADNLGIMPIEDSFRSKIGVCIQPDQLDTIGGHINAITEKGNVGADYLKEELVYDINQQTPVIKEYFISKIRNRIAH